MSRSVLLPPAEVTGRPPGAVCELARNPVVPVADYGDVADLAAGAYRLAVHVHLDGRVAGHHVDVAVVDVIVVAAEHVGHHGNRGGRRRGAERQVQNGPQVLLELRGTRALDGPVTAVVRAHGELVDQQP